MLLVPLLLSAVPAEVPLDARPSFDAEFWSLERSIAEPLDSDPWSASSPSTEASSSDLAQYERDPLREIRGERWRRGQAVLQGFFGVSWITAFERDGSNSSLEEDDDAQAPLLGGGGQWKLGGKTFDFGLEALFSIAWRANAAAFVSTGGGTAVAVDVDTFVFDVYGGPFVNVFLGNDVRVYGSVGPVLEWVDWDEENIAQGIDESSSGFGTGLYARAGIEFALPDRTFLGLGVRWSESTVDLDNGLGDLELEGLQIFLSVSTGF